MQEQLSTAQTGDSLQSGQCPFITNSSKLTEERYPLEPAQGLDIFPTSVAAFLSRYGARRMETIFPAICSQHNNFLISLGLLLRPHAATLPCQK